MLHFLHFHIIMYVFISLFFIFSFIPKFCILSFFVCPASSVSGQLLGFGCILLFDDFDPTSCLLLEVCVLEKLHAAQLPIIISSFVQSTERCYELSFFTHFQKIIDRSFQSFSHITAL